MAANQPSRSTTGGYPGFAFWNELAQLYTEGLTAQVEQLGQLWGTLTGNSPNKVSDLLGESAKLWQSSYGMLEDLMYFPIRRADRDRPTWISMIWNRSASADAPNDEVTLNRRLLPYGDPLPSSLQALSGKGETVPAAAITVRPDATRARLQITIDGTQLANLSAGSYLGAVYLPSRDVPVAILMLTIT
jgi:hypothetical protein